MRLVQRFDMSIDELKHIFKTGKHLKVPSKEGDIGRVVRKIGERNIEVVYCIKDEEIRVITIKGGR